MATCIALLRGINVGKAKRIAMADLRSLFEKLGYTRIATLLNSGNVVFDAPHTDTNRLASAIETAIQGTFGFPVAVVTITATDLKSIIQANPLWDSASDPAKHLVAFVSSPTVLADCQPLPTLSWQPEAIAVGNQAAYLWCPGGIHKSRLMQAFSRLTGDAATTRNWATVLKLQALAELQ
jgi:uncharacterized protein (DUF1697 family)